MIVLADKLYLDEFIRKSGKKKSYLAERCGMTRQTFFNKCQNPEEFRADKMIILCDEIGISTDEDKKRIFLP